MVGLRDPQIGTRNSKAEAAACPSREYPATSAAKTAAIRRAVAIGRASAQHALDSRQELTWLIGFGDVIVGAGPLTLHQADQARADFAAKRISLICDAHVIPLPELEHDRIRESNSYPVTTAEQVNKLTVPAKQPSVAL